MRLGLLLTSLLFSVSVYAANFDFTNDSTTATYGVYSVLGSDSTHLKDVNPGETDSLVVPDDHIVEVMDNNSQKPCNMLPQQRASKLSCTNFSGAGFTCQCQWQ